MRRPPTSPAANRKRLQRIAQALEAAMPEAKIELSHRSPWELLVATILSAQCTDQRVNQVTPALFTRYKTPSELAKARLPDVEAIIRSTGFFKSKAKNIVACSQVLTERFGQRVPECMDDLVTLPGVGHVKRVANRLDLTKSEDPVQIEQDLQQLLPSSQWTSVSQRLLLHGRYICLARRPSCGRCSIYDDCYAREKLLR
jgi:endonuclease-3